MDEFLFGEDRPYSSRELQWLGGWDPWLQVMIWVLVALTIALTLYNYRHLLPLWRRALLLGLRGLIIVGIVAVFYQPAFLEETVARSKNHVAVFLDASESMDLPHGEKSRMELVRNFITNNGAMFTTLEVDNTLSFHLFGERVRDAEGIREEPETLKTSDAKTDILGTLRSLEMRADVRDLGGVIVVTDGIDTGVGDRSGLGTEAKDLVAALGVPIHAFVPQGADRLKDVAIERVAYNNFAFAMNATSMDATVRVHGYGYGRLAVTLRRDGREIDRKTIAVTPNQRRYDVTFDWVPKKLGKRVFAMEVEHLEDEVYGDNNRREFLVNVLRDKIRVLQIVGQPSWDERFLRNHLKQDPNVDLISFFILVNPYGMNASPGETALIPFPARELFEEELGGFDLVIFQNFNYGPFRTRQYLPRIPPFVREGGAFVMVGGPLSFSAGGYYGTPVTQILPVELPQDFSGGFRYGGTGEESVFAQSVDTSTYRARLTDAGKYHPVTRLALEPRVNVARWANLDELEGINKVTRPKKDAIVLVDHPELKDRDGRSAPLVAVREVDKGRTMAVLTDSTWHWGFKAGNEGRDPRLYDTFWSNAIRWLVKDPELDLIRVRARQETVRLGDTATVRVEVFQPDYRPAAGKDIEVVVRRRRPADGPGEGDLVSRATMKTDGDGRLTVTVPVDKAGVFEVEASAKLVAGRATRGVDLFVGSSRKVEFDRVVTDGRWIDALTKASGGAVHDIEKVGAQVEVRPPRVSKVTHRRYKELWNTPFAVLMLAALFGVEWWIRRRWGYL